jgi:hypothetical protein
MLSMYLVTRVFSSSQGKSGWSRLEIDSRKGNMTDNILSRHVIADIKHSPTPQTRTPRDDYHCSRWTRSLRTARSNVIVRGTSDSSHGMSSASKLATISSVKKIMTLHSESRTERLEVSHQTLTKPKTPHPQSMPKPHNKKFQTRASQSYALLHLSNVKLDVALHL